jgi:hypothetical protein
MRAGPVGSVLIVMMYTSAGPERPGFYHRLGVNLGLTFGYVLSMALLLIALSSLKGWPILTEAAFGNWDTKHYLHIKNYGYDFQTTAFFPLFSYVWRWLDVSARGMAAVNAAMFASSLALLGTWLRWSWQETLLASSVPMICFMGLAYSEALFFVAGIILLRGLQRQHLGLQALGLLLCSVGRSAAFVMVPALLITAYLTRSTWGSFARQVGVGIFASGLGLLLSVYAHYLDTGRWFVFFAAQKQLWNNQLQVPAWPLTNWGGNFATRCEAITFLFALTITGYLVWLLVRRVVLQPAAEWAPVAFSLLYVAGIAAITLATKGGVLVSLSRYVWATPFGLLTLVWGLQHFRIDNRRLLWVLGAAELCWFIPFGAFGHIRTILLYLLVSGYVLLIVACGHENNRIRSVALALAVVINSGLMLRLLYRFLSHEWVG